MPMKVLDNPYVNLEFMPGNQQDGSNDKQQQAEEAAGTAQKKTGEAVDSAQKTAKDTADSAKQSSQSWSEAAQAKSKGLQDQAGQYQSQAAEGVKSYGEGAEKAGHEYVQGATESAHGMAKENLPEGAQSYAGSAVNYTSNLATGTVGTLGGGVKDLGETVGNAGYSTVAGIGKTGYNLGSGLGGAVMGKDPNAAKQAEDATKTEEEVGGKAEEEVESKET